MEFNPTRMCELLVGLPGVNVLAVDDVAGELIVVMIEAHRAGVWRPGCGARATVKVRPVVELVDLPCFGRPARLAWRKHRLCCREPLCPVGSWTWVDERIAAPKMVVTARAWRWATVQVGRHGRAVSDVAAELGCDWHTVNDAVIAYGEALLAADTDRVGAVDAVGLDETLFVRTGRYRTQSWCTSIIDVSRGRPARLIEIIEGRAAAEVLAWIDAQPEVWRAGIGWGVLDMSGPYRKVYDDSLPDTVQVADRFHVVKHAGSKLDECRRRVQNETMGHRGHKDDPLYRARRLLTKAHDDLDERGEAKLLSLLEAGDPRGEVRMTWHAKETVRGLYSIVDPATATAFLDELIDDMADTEMPTEVRSLAGTLRRWRNQILAWHPARVSNGPTEELNNLIKRIKRVEFGMRRFRHYRIRVLLYAGRPNWDLLDTITPRSDPKSRITPCPGNRVTITMRAPRAERAIPMARRFCRWCRGGVLQMGRSTRWHARVVSLLRCSARHSKRRGVRPRRNSRLTANSRLRIGSTRSGSASTSEALRRWRRPPLRRRSVSRQRPSRRASKPGWPRSRNATPHSRTSTARSTTCSPQLSALTTSSISRHFARTPQRIRLSRIPSWSGRSRR